MVYMLLGAFVVAFVVSFILCVIALVLFPWFRSGERKPGNFRPDQSTGKFQVDLKKDGKVRRVRAGSMELPLVGGVAMIAAVLAGCIAVGIALNFTMSQWTVLGVLLAATVGFGFVGFLDDWRKVYRGNGISELQKLAGVVVVSLGAAVALNRLIVTGLLSARFAYPPYSQLPVLGNLLKHTHFAWIAFFLLMTVTVSSSTSLAVDFADGMDGLCGGLLFSAALAFTVILAHSGDPTLWPLVLATLAIAGASLGYLPLNWPSSWRGKRSPATAKRRAKLIMGDTGSLALGGLLALVAVISRNELLMVIIGGIFLLEGLSALISARILVKFFRRFLYLERFGTDTTYAHTEFPLPFLATPMHHHFDLLGWDRKRLVYAVWLLGAVLGVLGVASVLAPFSFERYLARAVGLLTLVAIWQTGPFTRYFFVGLARRRGAPPNEPRYLALFYGYPFKLFGIRLYRCIDVTQVAEDAIGSPIEDLSLWQRVSVFDARALLGYYCYRAGETADALRVWEKIPPPNLKFRPDIQELLDEVRHRAALEAEVPLTPPARIVAPDTGELGASRYSTQPPARQDDPGASQFRLQSPSSGMPQPPHLEPASPSISGSRVAHNDPSRLWSAAAWNAATMPSTDDDEEPSAHSNGFEPGRDAVTQPARDDADAGDADPGTASSSGTRRPSWQ